MMKLGRKRLRDSVLVGIALGMMLLIPAGSVLAAGKKVTISQQNVSAAHVLKSIAEQAGVQLIMTPGIDDIISVNVKGQSWEAAIKQIASQQGYHVWIEGNYAVVSKEKLGRQLPLNLIAKTDPQKNISINAERISLTSVLERVSGEIGVNILSLPGKGEDLVARKLPSRTVLNVRLQDVHWRVALELVARTAGCKVEAVAENVFVVKQLDVVIKAADRNVRDVIRDISEQSGINVVVSQKVQGTVTVNLDGVPWAEALDAIVTSLGLSWRQHGENTIIISGEPRKLETDVAFFDVKYLTGDKIDIALKAIRDSKEKESDLAGKEPPFVFVLNDKPHVLRQVQSFLERYDKPAVAEDPLEFDLSKITILVDHLGRYGAGMTELQKRLFYLKFKQTILPVLSEQAQVVFLPIVDKVMVVDVPQNLTYVQEIVTAKFPPVKIDLGPKKVDAISKDYDVNITDPKRMAAVLRGKLGPDSAVEAYETGVAISATLRQHKKVQGVLKAYDVEPTRKEYSVLYKPIDTLAPMLKQKLSALATVEIDGLTRSIILEAPAPDHDYAERFLKVQDIPAADAITVKVFKLKFAKAADLSNIIQKFLASTGTLFAEETEEAGAAAAESEKAEALEGKTADEKTEEGGEEEPAKKEEAPKQLTEAGTLVGKIEAVVLADISSNSLIVTARGDDMPKIQDLIEKLDEEPEQVLVEGRIVETTVTDFSDIGLDFRIGATISGATLPTTFPFEKRYKKFYDEMIPDHNPALVGTTEDDEYPPGRVFAYPEDATGFQQFGTLSMAQLSLTLAFIEQAGDTKLISKPRLVILDNSTAKFLVTETWEYRKRGEVTQGDGGQIAFEYEYANAEDKIEMEITPQITPNGKVLMSLKPDVTSFVSFDEINNPDGTMDKLPHMVKRTVETKVIVADGMTVVLAGLVRDWGRTNDNRVPFLGRIPILGRLFSKELRESSSRNLLFFFTPMIMKDDESHELRAADIKAAYDAGLGTEVESSELVRWDRKPSRPVEGKIATQRPLNVGGTNSTEERR